MLTKLFIMGNIKYNLFFNFNIFGGNKMFDVCNDGKDDGDSVVKKGDVCGEILDVKSLDKTVSAPVPIGTKGPKSSRVDEAKLDCVVATATPKITPFNKQLSLPAGELRSASTCVDSEQLVAPRKAVIYGANLKDYEDNLQKYFEACRELIDLFNKAQSDSAKEDFLSKFACSVLDCKRAEKKNKDLYDNASLALTECRKTRPDTGKRDLVQKCAENHKIALNENNLALNKDNSEVNHIDDVKELLDKIFKESKKYNRPGMGTNKCCHDKGCVNSAVANFWTERSSARYGAATNFWTKRSSAGYGSFPF